MLKPLFKDVFYMAVGQRIVDFLSTLVVFHQIGKAQRFKLVGNRRFRHAKQYGNVANAHFLPKKRPKYADAGTVGKHLVQVGKVVKILLFWHGLTYPFDHILVDNLAIAHRRILFHPLSSND